MPAKPSLRDKLLSYFGGRSPRSRWNPVPLRLDVLEDRTVPSAPAAGLSLRGGAWSRIGQDLTQLYQDYVASGAGSAFTVSKPPMASGAAPATPAFTPDLSSIPVHDGYVTVDAVATGDPNVLKGELQALGMQVSGLAGHLISGMLPIAALPQVAALTDLNFAQPSYSMVNVGAVTSEGDKTLHSDQVRQVLGNGVVNYDGTGVTVGVLSDSFDKSGNGSYAADVASGDLPNNVNVVQDFAGGEDEGRGMLQVVHDVAPGASLAFATADTGQAGFAANIQALANPTNHANVIVDDVTYFAEPMFEDGVIAQAVNTVTSAGIAYFSSSANNARNSYQDSYRPGDTFADGAFTGTGANHFFGGVAQNFASSGPIVSFQSITLHNGDHVEIGFQWDSPYASAGNPGGATSDFDLYLIDPSTNSVVAASASDNIGGDPFEGIFGTYSGPTANYNLMLVKFAGTDPTTLKYINFNNGAPTFTTNTFNTQSGTNFGHTNAANMSSVGAAFWGQTPAFGTNPAQLEFFSSSGGTPILFDTNGNRLASPLIRQHPDIVAPDGGETSFFGSSLGPNGFPQFFGTSEAAPHAAAVAALMLQAHPGTTPLAIYTAMHNTALNMKNAQGVVNAVPNFDVGYGLLQANEAILALGGPNTATISAADVGTANDGSPDTFRIVKSGTDLDFFVNGTLVFNGLATGITAIKINGSNDNDSLTVDETGGAITVLITYDGGTGANNSLTIQGGSFDTDTYIYTGPHSGSVQLGGTGPTITYSNLTPLTNTGAATNISFTLSAGTVSATLQDDSTSGNGMVQMTSTNATFETTTFHTPTALLTVNAGGGTDTITTAAGFSGDFNASLTILGNTATDSVILNALSLTTGTPALSVTAKTISVAGAVSVGSGGAVNLTAGTTINESGGAIATTGTLTTSSAGGTTLGGANAVGTFNATNTTSGDISLTNSFSPLAISGISQSGGNVSVTNTGGISLTGMVNAGGGNIGLAASVGLTTTASSGDQLLGNAVTLSAGSAGIGTTANPMRLNANSINAATSGNGNIVMTENGTISVTNLDAGTGTARLVGGTFNLSASNVVNANSTVEVDADTFGIAANTQTVAQLIINGGAVTGTTGILTSTAVIDGRSGSTSAILAGGNGLGKTTGGTLVLSGPNTYTGATMVNGGTLAVTGSTAAGSAVTVGSGGTLGGTGTVGGSVTVNSGGTLAPGLSPGKLTMGSLALNSGATFSVDVNSPYATAGTDYDQANVIGNVTINGATLSLVGGAVAPTAGLVLTIIKTGGTITVTNVFVSPTSTLLPEGTIVGVAPFFAALGYDGGAGNDVILTAGAPDLTLTKTDSVNHATGVGSPWTWTLHVANAGTATAFFAATKQVVLDNLPNSNITYGSVTFANFVGLSNTNLLGSISGSDLTVSASVGAVSIPAGGSFDVTFTATASTVGTFANPRTGGTAAVDPGNAVSESNEDNNTGSDAVTVSATSVSLFFVNWGSSTAAVATASGGRLLPQGPTPRTNTIPWAGINSFRVHLNQSSALAAGDVQATGMNVANYGPVSVTPLGSTDYTITLAQPINAADRVTVTIGNAGIATFSGRLDVLPGDYNDDGVVSIGDDLAIRSKIGTGTLDTFADANGDGVVSIGDVLQTRSRIGTHLP